MKGGSQGAARMGAVGWAAALLAGLAALPVSSRTEEAAALVPAAFGIWTDRAGGSWSVEASGTISRIGSTMVNSGLALLVDEEKFAPKATMMLADGKEFVLDGAPLPAHPGLRVRRRIRVLEEPGGLRYAELFHNESADPVRVSVGLATNFSGNFKTFLSDRGRSEPVLLSPAETGVIVLPGTSQSSRAFLFTLAGAAGGAKPTISSQNRYGLTFRYDLSLPPGGGAAIIHHVAQVVIPQSFDRRALFDLCQPYALDRLRAGFAPEWSGRVVNAAEPPEFSARSAFAAGGVASLGLAAGSMDLLASGAGTRLSGKAEGGPAKLVSAYGAAEFPLDRLAALVGGKGAGEGKGRLFLRDGQVFGGSVEVPGLVFLPAGGSRLALEAAALDRLVFAGAAAKATWPEEFLAMIETHDGDRIGVAKGETLVVPLATPWGILPVDLGDLLWLAPSPHGTPGHRVELADGSVLDGFVEGAALALAGTELGPVKLPVSRLKRILTRAAVERRPGEATVPPGTSLRLAGGQTLAGPVGDTTLSLLVEGGVLETSASEVRRLVRTDGGAAAASAETEQARFRLERWDGGTIDGAPRQESLAVEVGGRTWQIPLRDIEAIDFASPALDAETLARIGALVRNLGSPDWATRETATRELGAFGYLARSVLQRELAGASDPEVERRLERILAGLN